MINDDTGERSRSPPPNFVAPDHLQILPPIKEKRRRWQEVWNRPKGGITWTEHVQLNRVDESSDEDSTSDYDDTQDLEQEMNGDYLEPSSTSAVTMDERSESMESDLCERMPDQQNVLVTYVASKVIKHARDISHKDEHLMRCPNCHNFPTNPVTGPCGHTRCTSCIMDNGACPCGVRQPDNLNINILVQDLISKITQTGRPRNGDNASTTAIPDQSAPSTSTSKDAAPGPLRAKRRYRVHKKSSASVRRIYWQERQMSITARFQHAETLMGEQKWREAAPHLAHVAASRQPLARRARLLLGQAIKNLSGNQDPRFLTQPLYRAVRDHSSLAWLKPRDLECIICYGALKRPITIPCGHTFCRICIVKILDTSSRCPLCSAPLSASTINQTSDTIFISSAMAAIHAVIPPPRVTNFISIFTCTVAYPGIPCPLLIFDPRYGSVIKRILESESRQFGMVAPLERADPSPVYGTILEVRDCVQFEDGRFLLSTVGRARFKVKESIVKNGFQMARVETFNDAVPTSLSDILDAQILSQGVLFRTLRMMARLDHKKLWDIYSTFGRLPIHSCTAVDDPNGPQWLWWLIAILPIRDNLRIHMMSTRHIMKRLNAVHCLLERIAS